MNKVLMSIVFLSFGVMVSEVWAIGLTTRVSLSSNGEQPNAGSYSPSMTADARWVVFESDATNLASDDDNDSHDVFMRDTATGETKLISRNRAGDLASGGSSVEPVISPDGLFVAFSSRATNLVSNDTNNQSDIFLVQTQTQKVLRVNVSSSGDQAIGGGKC